jgi:hypothetical protein
MADLNTNFPANASTENKSKADSRGGMPIVDGRFDKAQLPDHTAGDPVKDSAKRVLAEAKNAAGEAYDTIAEKAASRLDEKRTGLSGELSSVAESFRNMGRDLSRSDETRITSTAAKYTDAAAQKLDQVAGYFEQNDLKAMLTDVKDFARNNPAIFLGGAFALGVAAARFLKSSPMSLDDSGESFETGPANSGSGDRSLGAAAGGR